jgi:uncharacterized protein (DUF1778 family)
MSHGCRHGQATSSSFEGYRESPTEHICIPVSVLLPVQGTYTIMGAESSYTMRASSVTRDDRIELRASREQKRILATAAAYEHLDLTTFVMRAALPAAEEIVARHERITLSARDSLRVLELLENPPAPSPALLAAARRRRKRA